MDCPFFFSLLCCYKVAYIDIFVKIKSVKQTNMDSADELENYNSKKRLKNECDKAITPKNVANSNTNIVHKLFNREVRHSQFNKMFFV